MENDSNYQNAEQVEAAIQKVIGSAPGVLDNMIKLYSDMIEYPQLIKTLTGFLHLNIRQNGSQNENGFVLIHTRLIK